MMKLDDVVFRVVNRQKSRAHIECASARSLTRLPKQRKKIVYSDLCLTINIALTSYELEIYLTEICSFIKM